MSAVVRPNFIVIGPGRSGTTWMYRVLGQHPQIGVSSAKETLFFEHYHHKGEAWYLKFFRDCRGRIAVGEFSNTYVFSPRAAERIHRFDPGMRLISSLRNPIDRAFSGYLFMLRNAQADGPFERVIEQYPELIDRGRYATHLGHYLRLFPRRQLLVLIFEQLRRDPEAFARRIYEFLGVDAGHRVPGVRDKAYAAARPRSRLLARAAKWGGEVVRAAGYPQLVTRVKDSVVERWLYRPYGEAEYPRMAPETRARLEALYRDEVARVSELVGEDLAAVWFR